MTRAERIAAAIAWYTRRRRELPSDPFQLSQGVRVAHPTRFYAALDEAIAGWQASDETTQIDVSNILLRIRKLRTFLEARHADAT